MPAELREELAAKVDADSVEPWMILFMTATAAEIADAIRKNGPPR